MAGPPALLEVRKAGERFRFRGVHQVRANFIRDAKRLRLEERWIDLKTGWTKQTVREGDTDQENPLAEGIPDDSSVPLVNGLWVTEHGLQQINYKTGTWEPIIPHPRIPLPRLTKWLSSLSLAWMRTYRPPPSNDARGANPNDPPDDQDLGPLQLTTVAEHTEKLGNGEHNMQLQTTAGLITAGRSTTRGIVLERWENFFETDIDLSPSSEAQQRFQFFAKLKPVPVEEVPQLKARLLTRKAFGFRSVYDAKANGLRIVEPLPGSPAQQAGLQKGDLVTRVNGMAVLQQDDSLQALLAKPGPFELTVARGSDAPRKLTIPAMAAEEGSAPLAPLGPVPPR